MPTIGPFHGKYWAAKAGASPPPAAQASWMYPSVQSVVTTPHMVTFVPPLGYLVVLGAALRRGWETCKTEWRWFRRFLACRTHADRRIVLERVLTLLESEQWTAAQREVQACATTPKFHQPEQWIAYSRIVKSDPGQAQNIWRHMKVVIDLKAADPTLTNADAHLLAELAYQSYAGIGRPNKRVVPRLVKA